MSARLKKAETLEYRLAALKNEFHTLLDVFLREQRKIERLNVKLNAIEHRQRSQWK